MRRQQTHLKNYLRYIIQTDLHLLRAAVACEALDHAPDMVSFFSDLLNHGCQSGIVKSLIYYNDRHKFYDEYFDEIEIICVEYET